MASLTPTHDLPTITEGDDVTIPVTFVKKNGSPVDISGWTTSLTIAEQTRGQQGGGTAIIQKDVAPADATGGKTNFHLDPADTAGLSGPKRYDIQVTQDNSVVKTVVLGTVAFDDGVTDRDITSSGPPGTTGSLTADGIEVTMGDGDISVSVSVAGAFSSADAVAAMDGATITPKQVGTSPNPFTGYVDELSVGTNNQPVFQDYTNVVESEQSSTATSYSPIGHTTGYYPSMEELSRGTMNVYVRWIHDMKSDDGNTDVFSEVVYNTSNGSGFFSGSNARTSSTTYTSVDSGWLTADDITTTTEPFSLQLMVFTPDNTIPVSVKNAMIMVGVGQQ